MKSDVKSSPSTDASAKPSTNDIRKLGQSRKSMVNEKTMSRLERIRLAVLFVVLAGLAIYAWRSHQWRTEVREINVLLKNEDVNAALDRIRGLERNWGRSGESSFLKGRVHRYLGQVEHSTNALNEARVLGYSPERIDHEQVLLEIEHVDSQVNEKVAQEVIASYQADIEENATALVRGLLRTNDLTGANLIITIWNNEEPDSPRLKYLVGLTAEKMGDMAKAKEALEESYDLDPEYIPAWLELANVYWRDNNIQEAHNLFEAYFEKRPDDPQAEGGRVETELALGEYDKVVDYFKSYSQALDTSGRGRIFLAQAYEGLDKYPEVINTIAPLIKDWPDDIVANQLLAVAYRETGDNKAAEVHAERARLGVLEQAKITALRTQLGSDYSNAKLHQEVGSILMKYVSRVEGIAELQVALALDPKNKLAHQDLAYLYEVTGNTELAKQHRNASAVEQ